MTEQQFTPDSRRELLQEAEELRRHVDEMLERMYRTPLGPEYDALQNEVGHLLNAEQNCREQAAALAFGGGGREPGQGDGQG